MICCNATKKKSITFYLTQAIELEYAALSDTLIFYLEKDFKMPRPLRIESADKGHSILPLEVMRERISM